MKKHFKIYMPLALGLIMQFSVLALIVMNDPHTLTVHSSPVSISAAESLASALKTNPTSLGLNQ